MNNVTTHRCSLWQFIFVMAVFVGLGNHHSHATKAAEWMSANGPPGAFVSDVTIHPTNPDILLAPLDGGGVGVYRSTDGGQTWNESAEGLTSRFGWKAYFDPSDPNGDTAYLTTWGTGLHRTTNGGTSWEFVEGTPNSHTWAMAFAQRDPNYIFLAGFEGVHKSSDGGASWNPVMPDIRAFSIGVAPEDEHLVYVGTWSVDRKIYRSEDGGSSWIALTNGLPNANFNDIIPIGDGTLVYAATDDGVYMTYDRGDTWTAASNGLNSMVVRDIECLCQEPESGDASVLYAATDNGVFVTTNGGENWEPFGTGLPTPFTKSVEVDPAQPDNVFVAVWGGVGNITDANAGNWSFSRTGLPSRALVIDGALAIKPTAPHMMIAGTFGGGLYRTTIEPELFSSDIGWDPPSQATARFLGPAVNNGSGQNAYTSHYVYMGTDGRGVFRSPDDGDSWESIGPSISNIATIKVGNSPDVVYIGAEDGNFRSFSFGDDFSPIPSLPPWAVGFAFHPDNENVIYSATWADGAFKTTDGGFNWEPINTGLNPSLRMRCLAMDPSDPQVLYIGTQESGVFKTHDGGENWVDISGPLNNSGIQVFHIGSLHRDTIYAGTRVDGIFLSLDAGDTWVPFNDGLPPEALSVQAIVPAPFNERLIYIGTSQGVYFIHNER